MWRSLGGVTRTTPLPADDNVPDHALSNHKRPHQKLGVPYTVRWRWADTHGKFRGNQLLAWRRALEHIAFQGVEYAATAVLD